MPPVITTSHTLIVFSLIIIIAIIIAVIYSKEKYENSRISIFISSLSGMSVFIAFLFYYSIVDLQFEQRKLFSVNETVRLNEGLDVILEDCEKFREQIPNFVMSINPLIKGKDTKTKEGTDSQKLAKYILSYKIFSLWQDLIISTDFIKSDTKSYIVLFLQHAYSKNLHEEWAIMENIFEDKTCILASLLFEYSNNIKELNIANFTREAYKLLKDDRFISLRTSA